MNGRRFDVIYWEHGPKVDYHFCREWDEDGGCYGTNPLHGFSWEEARDLVAMWHKAQAEYWESLKEEEWEVNMTNEELEWAKDGDEGVSLLKWVDVDIPDKGTLRVYNPKDVGGGWIKGFVYVDSGVDEEIITSKKVSGR